MKPEDRAATLEFVMSLFNDRNNHDVPMRLITAAIKHAVEEERQACAKICREVAESYLDGDTKALLAADKCYNLIRARQN